MSKYVKCNDICDSLYYVEEKKTTAEYRLKKFKKRHEYNPSDGTIKMNGKRVQFTTGGSTKKNTPVEAANYRNMRDTDHPRIHMNTSSFNRKHPKTDEFIFRHEEGHDKINDRKDGKKTIKDNRLKRIYRKMMDNIYDDYSSGKITYDEYIDKNKSIKTKYNKVRDRIYLMKDEKKENDKNENDDIQNIIKKYHVNGNHGTDIDEYKADKIAASHVGKRVAKRALKDTEKSLKRSITDEEKKELRARKTYLTK